MASKNYAVFLSFTDLLGLIFYVQIANEVSVEIPMSEVFGLLTCVENGFHEVEIVKE